MSSASSDRAIVPCQPSKRPRMDPALARQLAAHSNQTKSSLVDTLAHLNTLGLLEQGVTKRQLRHATEHHAKHQNEYGKVVERIQLDAPGLKYLDVVNPFAFMHYLCSISTHFADMMHTCCKPGRPLRLVIYNDGMNPGNPFRPEKSGPLQIGQPMC